MAVLDIANMPRQPTVDGLEFSQQRFKSIHQVVWLVLELVL